MTKRVREHPLRRCSAKMCKSRSVRGVRQLDLDVNRWATDVPTVEACRPPHCPRCGISSRPVGESLNLYGHGVVARQFWGPRGPSESDVAEIVEILLRRFLCVACGAVTSVGPSGTAHRKLYSGGAIAFALALWTLDLLTVGAVRERVSPWKFRGWSVEGRWSSLKRWGAELVRGGLWRSVGRAGEEKIRRPMIAQELIRLVAHVSPAKLGPVTSSDIFAAAKQIRGGPSIG